MVAHHRRPMPEPVDLGGDEMQVLLLSADGLREEVEPMVGVQVPVGAVR